MPKNGFWTVFEWMAEAARAVGLTLPHSALHEVTNAYLLEMYDMDYNPLTYKDGTGEAACRRWLNAHIKEMAA